MRLTISRREVRAEPLQDIRVATVGTPFEWVMMPHLPYRLLRVLCRHMRPGLVLEWGTGTGASAAAMAPYCRLLYTRDVTDCRAPWFKAASMTRPQRRMAPPFSDIRLQYSSVTFQIREIAEQYWGQADLIYLDIGAHEGDLERDYMERFAAEGFKGLLLLDDMATPEYPGMQALWKAIERPKMDLTEIGHSCGTGAVFYGDDRIEVVE